MKPNPYRVSRWKAGRTAKVRRDPNRRLHRISMAIKRFEARYVAPIPARHWEEVDLPYELPADVAGKLAAGQTEYAQRRRENLERLLLAIEGEVARAAKKKAEDDEHEAHMRAQGLTKTGRPLGWRLGKKGRHGQQTK